MFLLRLKFAKRHRLMLQQRKCERTLPGGEPAYHDVNGSSFPKFNNSYKRRNWNLIRRS